jgi:hypothetical protein
MMDKVVIEAGNVALSVAVDHYKCVALVPITAVLLRKNPAPILLADWDPRSVKIL